MIARRKVRVRRGVAVVESALVLGVFALLFFGVFEYCRFLLVLHTTNNAARDGALTVAQLDSLFSAVPSITQPFDFPTKGRAIVTSVHAEIDDDPEVAWQRGGGGTLAATSQIGAPGNDASIPADLPARAGDTIIVAEIFFEYQPLFDILLDVRTLRRIAYVRPRLGLLTTLDP